MRKFNISTEGDIKLIQAVFITSGRISMKETMTHEEIRDAFSDLYNRLYLIHRKKDDKPRSDESWEELIKTANQMNEKYNSLLVRSMVNAILKEMELQEKQNADSHNKRQQKSSY